MKCEPALVPIVLGVAANRTDGAAAAATGNDDDQSLVWSTIGGNDGNANALNDWNNDAENAAPLLIAAAAGAPGTGDGAQSGSSLVVPGSRFTLQSNANGS